ncbi:MAG: peptide deformylase [Planctomycetes bacterium]|nr:peptide deformylase [Planctomycetota bacterium]
MDLIYYPNPILKKQARPLERIDGKVRQAVREMFEVMYRHKGVGLAAPQVGWSARLFVINLAGNPAEGAKRVYINPRLTAQDGETLEEEGCLSIPDVRGKVLRSKTVTIRAQALDGKLFTEEAADLCARVLQHEIDHLDGILFIERLGAAEQLVIKKTLKRLAESSRAPSGTST